MPTHFPRPYLLRNIDAAFLNDAIFLRGVERIEGVQNQQQARDFIIDYVTLHHPGFVEFVGEQMENLFSAVACDNRTGQVNAKSSINNSIPNDVVLNDMVIYAAAMAGSHDALIEVRAMYLRVYNDLKAWIDTYGHHAPRIRAVDRWIEHIKERQDHARLMIATIDLRVSAEAASARALADRTK